jgi:hypothetical protein
MKDKETVRKESRILCGGLIVGIAAGLGLIHFLAYFLDVSLSQWSLRGLQLFLIVVGVMLINSGITKHTSEDEKTNSQPANS